MRFVEKCVEYVDKIFVDIVNISVDSVYHHSFHYLSGEKVF